MKTKNLFIVFFAVLILLLSCGTAPTTSDGRPAEDVLNELGIPFVREGNNLRLQIPPVIYFVPNVATVEGLNPTSIAANNSSLRRVAELIGRLDGNRVIVEGHANPTTPTGAARNAENPSLISLSEARARWVSDQLVGLGVEQNRLTTTGVGASRPAAPFGDTVNAWQNRRVEFLVVR